MDTTVFQSTGVRNNTLQMLCFAGCESTVRREIGSMAAGAVTAKRQSSVEMEKGFKGKMGAGREGDVREWR